MFQRLCYFQTNLLNVHIYKVFPNPVPDFPFQRMSHHICPHTRTPKPIPQFTVRVLAPTEEILVCLDCAALFFCPRHPYSFDSLI